MTSSSAPSIAPCAEAGGQKLGGGELFLIAGPCVLEDEAMVFDLADRLAELAAERQLTWVFKASFDKANRTSANAFRGPGMQAGLELLARVKERLQVPILTDVHSPEHCAQVAEVVDILQIPAFLCRQTDLLLAAAETGRCINIKKGQFLAPWDLKSATEKCSQAGNSNLLVTERGSSFGYGRLVVDFTGLPHLAATGHPVVFDATHSVQSPGSIPGKTGGDRSQAPPLARAALATGFVNGLFFEVHPDPDRAPSDGPNMIHLADFGDVLDGCLAVHRSLAATQTA